MNVYQIITDRIIKQMEEGIIPWEKPWVNTSGTQVARSHNDGRVYSVLNQMLLGIPGEYVTFKQATAEKGAVKKGAKSSPIFFWSMLKKEVKDKDGNVKMKDGKPMMNTIPFLKYYSVFHLEDTENLKPKYVFSKGPVANNMRSEEIDKAIAEYLQRSGVTLRHYEQGRSYYRPSADEIILPHMNQFFNAESYYATLFHEMGHSTGIAERLNRKMGGNFGDEEYSAEELVAEITSAVLCNHFGIDTSKIQRNTTAYLQNWLQVLKGDSKMIVSAASKAEKAVKYILNIKDEKEVPANEVIDS
jgi:antirestriction protein ArdC